MSGLREKYQAIREAGPSLGLRLFAFLLLFLVGIMLGILAILIATGSFQAGFKEHQARLSNELSHISQAVYQDFGNVSVRTAALAEGLAENLEEAMRTQGIAPRKLAEHPEALEDLLEGTIERLTLALERTGSGGFVVLDATVNPAAPGGGDLPGGPLL